VKRAARGQAAVEFALVLPLMALLLLGIVDFSRVFIASNTLTQASREGDRYGSLNWNDGAGIETRARAQLTTGGIAGGSTIVITYLDGGSAALLGAYDDATGGFVADPSCTRTPCSPIPGDLVKVQVTLPWRAQTAIIQAVLPQDLQLSGATVSVIEQ